MRVENPGPQLDQLAAFLADFVSVKLEGIGSLMCRKCGTQVEGTPPGVRNAAIACLSWGVSPALVVIGGIVFLAMLIAIGWGLFR